MGKFRLRPLEVDAEQNMTGNVQRVSSDAGVLQAPPGHWVVRGMFQGDTEVPIVLRDDVFNQLCMNAEVGGDILDLLNELLNTTTDEYYPTIPCCFRCSEGHRRGRGVDCPCVCHRVRDFLKNVGTGQSKSVPSSQGPSSIASFNPNKG